MVHADLRDFLLAVVGASASFIGLLFVAISFVMAREDDSLVHRLTRRLLAESSYTALVNIFFISLVALVPGAQLGVIITILACGGIANSWHFARTMRGRPGLRRTWSLLALSVVVYAAQLIFGLQLLRQPPGYIMSNYSYMALMIVLFGMALGRAWELTGMGKRAAAN